MSEKDVVLRLGPFTGGLFDRGDKHDTPPNALREVLGFQWRDGPFPQSANGRLQYTASEVVTSKAITKQIKWRDESNTDRVIVASDGALWQGNLPAGGTTGSVSTLLNKIDCGQTGCTRNGDTVTLYGSSLHGAQTIKTGVDKFYFSTDGRSKAVLINSLVGETGFILNSYAGTDSETTSATGMVIERGLGATVDLALFDGRVAVSDGSLRWHWYGATKDGDTNYIFREHGLPVPTTQPTLALTTGGSLSAGDYIYFLSHEDARGVESTPIRCRAITAAANNKTTLSALPAYPKWAKKANVYRSIVNGVSGYSIAPDVPGMSIRKISAAGATSNWTYFGGSGDPLVTDQHKFRYLTFKATGNEYVIATNNSDTISIFGSATDEAATTNASILGGFSLDYAATGNIIDYTADTGLDYFNPAPYQVLNGRYQNDQGSTAASNITSFRSDGRLAWVVNNSQVEFSGRPFNSDRRAGVPDSGEGMQYPPEFEYSQVRHDINGNDNVPTVRLWSMGPDLYAGREDGLWGLRMPGYEVSSWNWEKRSDQYGLVAKDSVAVLNNSSFMLANHAGELDIIQFNGFEVLSVGRDRLDATLDEIVNPADATGVIYQGTYLLSYTKSGGSTHDRLIGYYIGERIFDKQPWGCGTFLLPYRSGNSFYLYCAAPTAVGHIYQVFGSAQDLGTVIQRLLRTGAYSIGEYPTNKVQWALVEANVKGP